MSDLVRFLETGNYQALVVLGLILALGWAVKQWRGAEKTKDDLHQARLNDVKEMVTLAVEVKKAMESVVKIVGEGR